MFKVSIYAVIIDRSGRSIRTSSPQNMKENFETFEAAKNWLEEWIKRSGKILVGRSDWRFFVAPLGSDWFGTILEYTITEM